jgi:hypothetical protein
MQGISSKQLEQLVGGVPPHIKPQTGGAVRYGQPRPGAGKTAVVCCGVTGCCCHALLQA